MAEQVFPAIPLIASYAGLPDPRDVRVIGRYAYIADFLSPTDLKVIDIGDPLSPILKSSFNNPGNISDLDVINGFAYGADGTNGLKIINVGNPLSPSLTSTFNTPGHAQDVKISGQHAYVADGFSGLQIINIANPSLPTFTSNAGANIGIIIGSGTVGGVSAVDIVGNYAYTISKANSRLWLQIINIADKSKPSKLGEYSFTIGQDGVVSHVSVVNNYAFIAAGDQGLKIIDVSNPTTPFPIGSYSYTSGGEAFDVQVVGNYAFVAMGFKGLDVIDISNPSAPVLAASYNPLIEHGGLSLQNFVTSVEIVDKHAFLTVQSKASAGGLWIVDVGQFTKGNLPNVSLSISSGSVNEGSIITANITTANIPTGTIFYYSLTGTGITSADISTGFLTGSGSVGPDGTFSFSRTIANDLVTEGDEILQIKLFTDSTRSVQAGETAIVLVKDTSVTALQYVPGSVTLGGVNLGKIQLGYALKNGSNTPLSITNAGAVAAAAGGWSALAAAAAGSGYDLYWKNINGTYAKWSLNSSAALTSGAFISSADFLQAETSLAADLDGDGKTGLSFAATKTVGNVQFGTTQLGYSLKNGNSSPLSITNAGAVAAAAGGWSALAAAAAGSGYDLYWKNINGTYAKWSLNSSAALTSGAFISSADFLQAETSLAADLDRDGITGLTYTAGSSTINGVNLGSTALGYALRRGSEVPFQVSNAGQFASALNPGGGWQAISAVSSGSGYELYWRKGNGATSQYARWSLSGTGALGSAAMLSPLEFFLKEQSLGVDLNQDGITGLTYTAGSSTINGVNLGSTALGYALRRGSEVPFQVSNAGQPASALNPGGGWQAISAVSSGSGYELYWRNGNTFQYARWNLSNTGVLTSSSLLSPSQFVRLEASLNADLNMDGVIGSLSTSSTPSYEDALRTGFGTYKPGRSVFDLNRSAFYFDGREWVTRDY